MRKLVKINKGWTYTINGTQWTFKRNDTYIPYVFYFENNYREFLKVSADLKYDRYMFIKFNQGGDIVGMMGEDITFCNFLKDTLIMEFKEDEDH